MNKCLILALCFYSSFASAMPETIEKNRQFSANNCAVMSENSSNTKILKNILFGSAAIGSLLSLYFWMPSTLNIINNSGIMTAIYTTHLPRVAIDLLSITAAITALIETNNQKEKKE